MVSLPLLRLIYTDKRPSFFYDCKPIWRKSFRIAFKSVVVRVVNPCANTAGDLAPVIEATIVRDSSERRVTFFFSISNSASEGLPPSIVTSSPPMRQATKFFASSWWETVVRDTSAALPFSFDASTADLLSSLS